MTDLSIYLSISLYIYLMANLKNVGVGVKCGDEICPGLMYADDAAITTKDEENLKLALKEVENWGTQKSLKFNAGKCAIVHFCHKGVPRSSCGFMIEEEEVPV
jgi:hypothetical protein